MTPAGAATSARGTSSASAAARSGPAARDPDRPAIVAVGLSFACLPLVRFGATGSATLADAAIALAIAAAFLWLADAGREIRLPYAVSVGFMVAAGAFATLGAEAEAAPQADAPAPRGVASTRAPQLRQAMGPASA